MRFVFNEKKKHEDRKREKERERNDLYFFSLFTQQNKIELVTIVGSRFTSQKQLTVELSNPERLVLTSIDSFVVVGKDDSLSFVSKDSVKWQREEALAQITNVEFVELPSADSDFVKDQTTIGFSQRLQMQWSHLIVR